MKQGNRSVNRFNTGAQALMLGCIGAMALTGASAQVPAPARSGSIGTPAGSESARGENSGAPDGAVAWASPLPPGAAVPPPTEADDPVELEEKQAEEAARSARAELNEIDEKVKTGQATQEQLLTAHANKDRIDAQFQKAARRADLVRLYRGLLTPIDVDAKQATVAEAVTALTKLAWVRVWADKSIPQDIRVTIDAHGVPLGTLLQLVARQANLMIAPASGYQGVVLDSWPRVTVNGVTRERVGRNAPWSDEWTSAVDNPPTAPKTTLPYPVQPSATAPASSPIVTSLGPKGVVVSEVGVGPKGEPGIWMTVYSLNGNRLVPATSQFHALRAHPAAPRP